MFSPFVLKLGSVFVQEMMKAMINSIIKKPSEVSKALDVIEKQSEQLSSLAHATHEGHMKDKEWLQGLVTELVRENRRALRELPEPVPPRKPA
jgi:hypothetical protein